jgi:hypothetical protein
MSLGARGRSFSLLCFFALVGLLGLAAPARAEGVVFPDAAQVTTDYPDEVERYTAFNLLAKFIGQFGSKPMSQSDSQKQSAYQSAALAMMQAKVSNGSLTPEYMNFVRQTAKLRMNPKFQQAVLKRYHLPGAGG